MWCLRWLRKRSERSIEAVASDLNLTQGEAAGGNGDAGPDAPASGPTDMEKGQNEGQEGGSLPPAGTDTQSVKSFQSSAASLGESQTDRGSVADAGALDEDEAADEQVSVCLGVCLCVC